LQWRESLSQMQAHAQAADLRLREAIDAMPAGFAIYDENDALVVSNKESVNMFPHLRGDDIIGKTYEALLRRAMDQGTIRDAIGCEDQWLANRLAERGKSKVPELRSNASGRWMHHFETRTPSGDLVLVRLDVTELVEKGLELERLNGQLARLSVTDGLTGIANRRQFDQMLQAEWQRSARSQQPLSLLMIDIDHFKRYNDHYGHVMGDECLRRVARILESCALRSGELTARYGGEEFALLLPGSDAAQARVAAQHCMDELLAASIAHANSPVSPCLTFSIGVATMVAGLNVPASALVQRADEALYCAKNTSRARFEVAAL
jgi:diguanylate cyclase (GGDEF)-like protein